MGDILSNVYNTYEDYKVLCKKLGVTPKDINNPYWLEDYRNLEKK